MPRGYPIQWEGDLDAKLRELYPMHLDTEIARELGVSNKAMRDHAKKLGLTKGDGYKEYFDKRNRQIQKIGHINFKNSGQFKKGNQPNHTFPKGEQPSEWVEKRVATLKRQYYEDSVRMKYGLEPKMKFHRVLRYDLTKQAK